MIATATACGVLSLLPGCFIPKIRQAVTGVALPPTYDGAPAGTTNAAVGGTASPDNSAQLRVDEFYNDPILLRYICQAMANSRRLKVLEEEIRVAQAATISTRGAYLPLIGFRAGAGFDQNSRFTPLGAAEKELQYLPGKRFPVTPGASLLGFNFLVPLDIWRALRNARYAAIERYYAAIEARNYYVTQLVADVAQNYYGLMALDQRLVVLNQIIGYQQQAQDMADAKVKAGRSTALPVQRFRAEVRKNQSEILIVRQEIVEVENRINSLLGRVPQPVERNTVGFYDLTIHPLSAGVPAQLLLNRPDIRQAERELAAAGLDVMIARAQFFPRLDINGSIGYQAFNPKYLFNPEALVFNAIGELAVPVINKAAIRADYIAANARQLESVYNYQQTIITAVVEVVNRLSMVENYTRSLALKRQQLQALEISVSFATQLFQAGRTEYIDVLFVLRDLVDARTVVIDTKRQQLSAIVNTYQALGGGANVVCPPPERPAEQPPPADQLPPPRPVMPGPGQLPPLPPGPEAPKKPGVQPVVAVMPAIPRGIEWLRTTQDVPLPAGR